VEIFDLVRYLEYLNIAGNVAVLSALAIRKLAYIYRLLFLYFLTDLVSSLLHGYMDPGPANFIITAAGGESIKLILSFWFVLGMYGLVLAPHPALAKFGERTVSTLVAASAAVSLVFISFGHSLAVDPDWVSTSFYRFVRTTDATIGILLLLMSGFLLWYPITIRRNVASYMIGFIVYFIERWVALLVADVWQQYHFQADIVHLSVAFGCMMFWVIMLRPEGETQVTVTGHRWNPLEAERLMRQLDALNERLARIFRK
jgi:hypothetical protein